MFRTLDLKVVALVIVVIVMLGVVIYTQPTTYVQGDLRFAEYRNNITCVYSRVEHQNTPMICAPTEELLRLYQYR